MMHRKIRVNNGFMVSSVDIDVADNDYGKPPTRNRIYVIADVDERT